VSERLLSPRYTTSQICSFSHISQLACKFCPSFSWITVANCFSFSSSLLLLHFFLIDMRCVLRTKVEARTAPRITWRHFGGHHHPTLLMSFIAYIALTLHVKQYGETLKKRQVASSIPRVKPSFSYIFFERIHPTFFSFLSTPPLKYSHHFTSQ
jgi:hypothetical protein